MSFTQIQNAGAAGYSATFSGHVTVGDLLTAAIASEYSGSAVSSPGVSDSAGNGPGGQYNLVDSAAVSVSGHHYNVAIYQAIATTGGSGIVVTYNPAQSGDGWIYIQEDSFVGTCTADGSNSATGTGTSLSSGSFTTTGTSDLVVGIGVAVLNATAQTWTAGGSMTSPFSTVGSGTALAACAVNQYGVAAGSNAATMSDTNSLAWLCVGAAVSAGSLGFSGAEGNYALSGAAASFLHDFSLPTAAGAYSVTGAAATLTPTLAATKGTYATAGAAAGLYHGSKVNTAEGTYALSGDAAGLAWNVATATAAAGLYATTGELATLLHAHKIPSVEGTYAVSGEAATLFFGDALSASAGVYATTGAAATLLHKHVLFAAAGAYGVTGTAAGLFSSATNILSAATGAYLISRIPAALTWQHDLFAGPGAYALTGGAALLQQPAILYATPGVYLETGAAAGLADAHLLVGLSGVYTITGAVADLVFGTGGVGPGTIFYCVYSNTGAGDPIDYDVPIATLTTTTYTTAALAHPGTWSFAVRAGNNFGIEQNLDCAVTFLLSASGVDISNIPPPPAGLRAFPMPLGAIRVEWSAAPTTGPRQPVGYHVYLGTTGTPNYSSIVATVLWTTNIANSFVSNIPGLIGGTTYTVGVRAYNATGEEANTQVTSVVPISSGPTAVTNLVGLATSASA